MLSDKDLKRAEELPTEGRWNHGHILVAQDVLPELLDEVERLNGVIESAVALAVLGDLETIKQIKVQHG